MNGYRIYTPLPPIPDHPDDGSESYRSLQSCSNLYNVDSNELYKHVRQGMKKIVKAQKLGPETLAALEILTVASGICTDRERGEGLADFMVSINFVKVVQKILKNHFEESFKSDDNLRQEIWDGVYNLLYIIWNLSDKTNEFCREILDSNLYADLLVCLSSPYLSPGLMYRTNESNMVQCLLSILHNLVHRLPISWPAMRNNQAVEILQPFRECSNKLVSCLALMIQAYIINEEDNEKVNSGLEIFQFLTEVLSTTVNGGSFYGIQFTILEVVDVINKLAVNDSNKKRIVEAGVLPYYVALMKGKGDWNNEVIAQAARGIWILGFKCKEEILKEEDCMETLKSLMEHSDPVVKEKASGALWILEKQDVLARKLSKVFLKKEFKRDKTVEKPVGDQSVVELGHIFISYQWDSKPTVLKVRDRLKSVGLKTWLDEDDMSGSVLEAMATAVEKATVVIICLSQKYKDSPNCRTEAEYTFRLRKKVVPLRLQQGYYPDGWLGLIVGSKLVFDVSQERRYEDSVKHLIKELSHPSEKATKAPETMTKSIAESLLSMEPVAEVPSSTPQESIPNPSPNSITSITAVSSVNKSIKHWKDKEVGEWLTKNKLQKQRLWFRDFDGSLLQEYAYMMRDAPESFYNHLFRHNVHIRDVLAIGKGLRELLKNN